MFTDTLPRNGRLLIRLLHSNGRIRRLLRGPYRAEGLYAAVLSSIPRRQ
jgi:hypothetical protein